MKTVVKCYAGTRYPERPLKFLWEGEWLDVVEVERRYRTPRGLRFHARTSENRCFSLFYDEALDAWDVRLRTSV
ncbi:MAG: hypothetical protein PVF04_06130 [Anaerolineae bacterium]